VGVGVSGVGADLCVGSWEQGNLREAGRGERENARQGPGVGGYNARGLLHMVCIALSAVQAVFCV
jgi:hypothetical protein